MPVIMHVDMDAFYVSVELRRRPELRGRPVWVGGSSRGVVLSASYEARAFGVEGGMSVARARRLCPDAVAIPPNFDAYAAASDGVFEIFSGLTSVVEPMSLDEAFLDVTSVVRQYGGAVRMAEVVRAMVADEQGVPCSVGIAPVKLVAKMASQAAKPDGLFEVRPGEVVGFLHPLPVSRILGVGAVTGDSLRRLGIRTIGDLATTPKSTLQRAFGARQGEKLWEFAWGIDGSRVVPQHREQSIGSQSTFDRDTDDPSLVEAELLRLSDAVASRMRRADVMGRTVTVHVRFADFRVTQRSMTLPNPTDTATDLYSAATKVFRGLRLERPRLRRVGIRVEGLVDADRAATQPALDDPERGWRDAELAADAAISRFGPEAVRRATLTRRRSVPFGRRGAYTGSTVRIPEGMKGGDDGPLR